VMRLSRRAKAADPTSTSVLAAAVGNTRVLFLLGALVLYLGVAFVLLPGGRGDVTHYNFGRTATLTVLGLALLVDLLPVRRAMIALSVMAIAHLTLFCSTIDATDRLLQKYLMPDGTVTLADIDAIYRSADELRATESSPDWDLLDSGAAIPQNAVWYYTRLPVRPRDGQGPYFPVRDIMRLLMWPAPLPVGHGPSTAPAQAP
jgi:hypothetical protein